MLFKNKIYIIVLIGLLFSTFLSFYYTSKFDVYETSSDNFENHHMIKSDILKFWWQANELKKDINNGKDFFKTGHEYRNPYLPPKIIYFLSSLINLDLYDQFENVNISKKKIFLLIFQAIIYYLAVIFFYREIKNIYPINTSLYIVGFLSFEPTLMLFHSSFWSESIFFSIQLIFLTLLIKNSRKISINFIAGLILGLLFLQRSIAMFYVVPIILYLIIIFKKGFIKPTIFFLLGYFLVTMFLGYHNYSRSGVFYVSPTQSKDGFYMYMLPTLISQKQNISISQASEKLLNEERLWIKKQNLDFQNEKDRLNYYNYVQKKSLKFMIENPIISTKYILKKTMHFYVLDPLRHVHFFYKYEYKGKPETRYYKSSTHNKLIPVRIIYTLLIYIICFLGLLFLLKNNKKNHLLIILLSLIYFTAMCSWIGNTRYFTPCLIYLSILFGNGLNYIINFKKKELSY